VVIILYMQYSIVSKKLIVTFF